jgi:outer membrane receptor protein involved in Fe transport
VSAGTTGKISGTVRDARTKEAIPSVNVVLKGTTLGSTTDIEGHYVILNVPPGRYTITATLIGYKRFEATDVKVSVDFTTPLTIDLIEGSVELDAVVVQAERSPLIRQDLTNPVASISSENISALPVTEISEVIGLQAGIVVDNDGSLHVRGGLGNEIAYTVNGMNINNPFGNNRSVGVATNAVEEVSVSSGTFSAEYGTSLSGVVNYVTKDGGARWTGSVKYLTGDYMGNQNDNSLYPNLGTINMATVNRVEASLGGPLIDNTLSFFLSGVANYNGGYLYGQRYYKPEDSYVERGGFPTTDPRYSTNPLDPYYFGPAVHPSTDSTGGPTGDGAFAPLNWARSYNAQANLSFRILPQLKLKYEFIYDFFETPANDPFSYQYKPDGRALANDRGYFNAVELTHTINERIFYTVKGSYTISRTKTATFDNPDDPRYLPSFYRASLPNTSYLTGGTDASRFDQKTMTWAGKVDLVAQALRDHEIKAGFEIRAHTLDLDSYTLLFQDPNDPNINPSFSNQLNGYTFLPVIPTIDQGRVTYERKPIQWSAYLQDKIELFSSFILNVGLRYDFFNPADSLNPNISYDLSHQDTIILRQNLVPASKKQMLQPRISVSFPITDQGTIRFSYGHFYQVGSLASLYSNPYYYAPVGTPSFGNPDVQPQKSTQYELGLQQGLTEDLRLEITGYYKDVNNYIYSQRIITARGDKSYSVLTNLAYANTRGITISLLKRRSPKDLLSATLDYTFQVAEGNRTEPVEEVFYNEQSGELSQTYLVPQTFDRLHTLTGTLMLSQPDNWAASFVGYWRTGTPYTPAYPSNVVPITFVQNSGRQPVQWKVDMKLEKFFQFSPMVFSLFLQVDNLFDTRNELSVYANSGRALYNIEEVTNPTQFVDARTRIARGDVGMVPMSAIDNYYQWAGSLGAPRLVRIGASMIF